MYWEKKEILRKDLRVKIDFETFTVSESVNGCDAGDANDISDADNNGFADLTKLSVS